jgi:hypothetical protein
MQAMSLLRDLIEASYDAREADRFTSTSVTTKDLKLALVAGRVVVERTHETPGACAHLSALWAVMLRNAGMPAYCVAGDLLVEGRIAFASDDSDISKAFESSNLSWGGHCWIIVGQSIGDPSIFATARAAPLNSNLRHVVLREFGPDQDLLFLPRSEVAAAGLDYAPKYVVREDQLNALLAGVRVAEALAAKKLGRNDPCFCGSGKKFKKCHGR